MSNVPADVLLRLSKDKRETALVGGVEGPTDTDEIFRMTFAQMAAAQGRLSPMTLSIERTPLVVYTGADAANRALDSNFPGTIRENNLDIKEGTTRHSFDDGYFAIEVHYQYKHGTSVPNGIFPTLIPMSDFEAPKNSEDHLSTIRRQDSTPGEIYRTSENSFAIDGIAQGNTYFLKAIYGLKWWVHS